MKMRYTPAHKKFFVEFVPGHSSREIAEEFNRRFAPAQITPSMAKSCKERWKLKSGTQRGNPKGCSRIYPPGFFDYLRAHNRGKSLKKITALINAEFSTEFSARQISSLRRRLHLLSGIDTKFKKGSIPHNKGKTGFRFGEKGWFKPGHVPHNHLPVGAEVIVDGYKKVKIAEPNMWKFSHVLEWERHNGPVPQGHCVVFKDGRRDNCAIENLMLITRAENVAMNNNNLRSPDPALTEATLAVLRLKRRISEIEKGE